MQRPNVGVGVGVMMIRDGKILLGLRNPDPVKAGSALHGEGTWTDPGGKLRFGESLGDCACREVAEETGMHLKKARVFCVSEDMVGDAHFVTIGMVADEFEGEPKVMEPDIIEWRWFPLDDLPRPLYPAFKKILDNYLEGRVHRNDVHGKA